MSTAQCRRTKTGTWGQIFPNEQVTEQQSALFMKKLLAVAVSNITYLRNIFPEVAFGDRCLEELNLKILKDDSSSSGACQVIKWVKGCFDALDKKYLRMLVMGIYTDPENPETVIESYTFKFSYTENGGVDIYRNKNKISSANMTEETKKATIRLLRTIVVLTQSLHSLPDDVFMTMKLWYYDDVTPGDYEPPGFQAADPENFGFEDEPMNIKVGDVITPFHTVKLRIKTDARQFELPPEDGESVAVPPADVEMEEEPVEQQQVSTGLDRDDDGNDGQTSTVAPKMPPNTDVQVVPEAEPLEADSVPGMSPGKPASDGRACSTTGSQPMSPLSQETFGVRCACGCNEDDGLMILCAKCKSWQHGVCFKIIDENNAPERHICDLCAKPNNADCDPTDPHLLNMSTIAKEATCLWRRALVVSQETSRVMVPALARRLGVEQTVAHGLMSRLEKEGFLKTGRNKKQGRQVDKEKLKEGMKKYFSADDENESQKNPESQINEEIENITNKAETLKLNEKKGPLKQKNILETLNKIKDNRPPQPVQPSASVPQPPRQGRKRAKLASGEEYDFDISNSQDVEEVSVKRHKASITKKKLNV